MPKRKTYTKKTDIERAWNKKKSPSQYAVDTLEMRKTFLIVCEGQTEKCYFKSFPVRTVKVEAINLEGQSKLKLVECAQEIAVAKNTMKFGVYSTWMTTKDKINFRLLIMLFIKHSLNFNVAYSNDAFELWFYLHYHYTDTAHLRDFYYERLSRLWNINYVNDGKRYSFCTGIYDKLKNDNRASQQQAIARAEKLFLDQQDKPFHEQNPVTAVYQLVRTLNQHILGERVL